VREREQESAENLPTHELVDHTSELIVRLRAATFPGIVAEATRAFGGLVPERARGPVRDVWHDFAIDGGDRTATLVDWLNELAYLGEAETWLPVDAEVEQSGASGVRIRAREMGLAEPFVLVKAATLHGARVARRAGGFEAEVTLDI